MIFLRVFAFLFLLLAVIAPDLRAQRAPADSFVKGELLVKFREGAASKSARDANHAVGSEAIETLGNLGWQRVRIPAGMTVNQAIAEYKGLEGVEFAQPNFYYNLQITPNDPSFSDPGMYGLTKISAPLAWDLTTGSSGVVVANIDTGVRLSHSDLEANIWTNSAESFNGIDDDANGFIDDVYGWDFFSNDSNPTDENGHGTHTAGIIGAVGNNAVGVVGVNWNVKIMVIKIYNSGGSGATSAMLINAYNYVRVMKNRGVNIRVTNNSYGGCTEACSYDQATKDAIDALTAVGILNVFAAGNAGVDNDVTPFYPSSYNSPGILAVGGSDQNDNRTFNFGATTVDLAAPSVGIYSTGFATNSSYELKSGTSMATPHVSGSAALLSALNPSLSPASLKATLMNTVDVLPAFNGMNKTGGRLNVDRALRQQTVCTFSPATSEITVPTKGGTYTMNVTSGQNCEYRAKSNAFWIKVTSAADMNGSGVVTFRVSVNTTITRTATVSIGGQSFTVRQSRN
jgi:subtilisin family serine protease